MESPTGRRQRHAEDRSEDSTPRIGLALSGPVRRPLPGAFDRSSQRAERSIAAVRAWPTTPWKAWSSQRHWHSHEDEFVYVLRGEVVLVTDAGEKVLRPGDCLQSRSTSEVELLVVGSRADADHGEYPDIDLVFTAGRYTGGGGYRRKDGTAY